MIIQFSFFVFFAFMVSAIHALDLPSALLQKSNELNQNLTIRAGTFIHLL